MIKVNEIRKWNDTEKSRIRSNNAYFVITKIDYIKEYTVLSCANCRSLIFGTTDSIYIDYINRNSTPVSEE